MKFFVGYLLFWYLKVTIIEEVPEIVLPEYRRNRSYVNSVLANNEIDRNFIYNSKLYKRTNRGTYILNPEMKITL